MAFENIIGHKQIREMLQSGLRGNTLPSAYIFSGVEGIGKMLTAMEYVKTIQCYEEGANAPCNKCPSCLKIESGNHPDLLILDKEGEKIKIDDIRECKGWLAYKAYGKKRIVIVNNTETITIQGSNAFLKTLEEPPANTLIILLTINLQSLLPTIVSRCRTVRFNRLRYEDIRQIAIERYKFGEKEAEVLASLSDGTTKRLALSSQGEEIAFERELSLTLLKEALSGNLEYILTETAPLVSDKGTLSSCLDFMSNIIRDISLIISGEDEENLLNRDIINSLKEISANLSLSWAVTAFDMLKETKDALNRNANSKLLLEEFLIGIRYAAGKR